MNPSLVEDTLYSVIGLPDFATPTEIEAMRRRFESDPAFAELRASQIAPGLRNVFQILGDAKQKQWYDLLLEAQLRTDGLLTPIADPNERIAIQTFAHELGFELQSHSDLVFRVKRELDVAEIESNSQVNEFSARLDDVELVFSSYPCIAQLFEEVDSIHLRLRLQTNQLISITSGFSRIVASHGDEMRLICLSHDSGNSELHAAYINRSQGVFAPLEHAGKNLFAGDRVQIAERLGIRGRPDRIRKLIREYYRSLADAIAFFEAQVDKRACAQSTLNFANRVHPETDWFLSNQL